jgi:hypothetical protein
VCTAAILALDVCCSYVLVASAPPSSLPQITKTVSFEHTVALACSRSISDKSCDSVDSVVYRLMLTHFTCMCIVFAPTLCCVSGRRMAAGRFCRGKGDQPATDYPTTLAAMWARQIGPRLAGDVARLAGRVEVRLPDAVAATVPDGPCLPEVEVCRVALRVAAMFGDDELNIVRTAVGMELQSRGKSDDALINASSTMPSSATTNPDKADVVARLLKRCGGDTSPTVRVLKFLHQKCVHPTLSLFGSIDVCVAAITKCFACHVQTCTMITHNYFWTHCRPNDDISVS